MQQIKGIIKIKIHQEKRNNDNKTNKQTNKQKADCRGIYIFLEKKKKRFQYASRVTFFLRFEGLSLGLRYRQTKKGFGKIFRDRKTQIYLRITQS